MTRERSFSLFNLLSEKISWKFWIEKTKRLMNNGTHYYTQPGFISLQYSYHMEQGPEVANTAMHLRTS